MARSSYLPAAIRNVGMNYSALRRMGLLAGFERLENNKHFFFNPKDDAELKEGVGYCRRVFSHPLHSSPCKFSGCKLKLRCFCRGLKANIPAGNRKCAICHTANQTRGKHTTTATPTTFIFRVLHEKTENIPIRRKNKSRLKARKADRGKIRILHFTIQACIERDTGRERGGN